MSKVFGFSGEFIDSLLFLLCFCVFPPKFVAYGCVDDGFV